MEKAVTNQDIQPRQPRRRRLGLFPLRITSQDPLPTQTRHHQLMAVKVSEKNAEIGGGFFGEDEGLFLSTFLGGLGSDQAGEEGGFG